MLSKNQSEIVDDSEPEREQVRQREKGERRRVPGSQVPFRGQRAPVLVIEITDDESTDNQRPPAFPSTNITSSATTSLGKIPTPSAPDNALSDKTRSDEENDEPGISLARFAYPGTAPTARPALSRQLSTASSSTGIKVPSTKKSTNKFATAHQFSDSEIGRVLKCVSCDIRWTARKTAAQKMLHIQSCARKTHLTAETVQVLLRKEIDSYKADTLPHKGKGNEVAPDPQTFLEDVVAEAAPRKKPRKKGDLETQETVRTVFQTRDIILDRARAVIGSLSTSGHDIIQEPVTRIQAGDTSRDSATLPSTQAFGQSALAQARQGTSRLLEYDIDSEEDSDCEHPPSTQTFAPSRLGALAQVHDGASLPFTDFTAVCGSVRFVDTG
ncbi:hypothetical protein H0H87_007908 [Tephrocybe sp. NHM501043]|nr:hypothetical protein H0H87_007908 [Tephrocybe sp. NHM501043]